MKPRMTRRALLLVSALTLVGEGANAQQQQQQRPAPVHTAASKDPAAATAGQYKLDPSHTAFSGATKFKRSDYGLTTLIPAVGDESQIMIETEFDTAK